MLSLFIESRQMQVFGGDSITMKCPIQKLFRVPTFYSVVYLVMDHVPLIAGVFAVKFPEL